MRVKRVGYATRGRLIYVVYHLSPNYLLLISAFSRANSGIQRISRGSFWASESSPLGLTTRKTSRYNLAIEISFVPSSQSTFNFSILRGTQVDFLLFNLLRPGPGGNAPD